MNDKTKPTRGPWKILERFPRSYAIEPDVAWLGDYSGHEKGENLANAELIAEAGTVYHETGLTPREILAQRDEAISVLDNIKEALDQDDESSYVADDREGAIGYAYQCAKTALDKLDPTGTITT